MNTTHGSVAAKVRMLKQAHPDDYCPVSGCLYRTGGGRCPKHMAELLEEVPAEVSREADEARRDQGVR